MKKAINGAKIIVFIAVVAAIFIGVTVLSAHKTYSDRREAEHFTEVDSYSMFEYCEKNVDLVLDALQTGRVELFDKICIDPTGAEDLLAFANWSEADMAEAVSMGEGSLMAKPDKDGCMDVSERAFVKIGKKKYVLFIETRTSRWGRTNDGVSAIAATTFEHFDATDYAWAGEKDGESVLVGELFWKKNS